MRTCIIGGGLTGLAAAGALAKEQEVVLLEERDHLGGCLSSYRISDTWVERFYHHCFSGDTLLQELIRRLGLGGRLEWLKGSTGSYDGGTCYPLTTPGEILAYPGLTLMQKARLAWLTRRSRTMNVEALDTVSAKDFILEHLGEEGYRAFFEPLLKSKFGERRDEVSAAWLVSRIAIRSDRGIAGERLGYIRGGFQLLIEAMEADAAGNGCSFRLRSPARSLQRDGSGWLVNNEPYDAVIATIPPQVISRIGGPDLPPVPYQGAACMTIGLARDVTRGIYWLNMKDPAPYGAVVSHTNFVPPSRYGGDHIVYLASYFSGPVSPGLDRTMIDDFCRRFTLNRDEIRWQQMAVEPCAGPVYTTGYRRLIPSYCERGLILAGMYSEPNYPERSMEGSLKAGSAAAVLAGKAGA
jgi:protoporphyrinogen oxidase